MELFAPAFINSVANYGPIVLIVLVFLWALVKWLPKVIKGFIELFREVVAALKDSTAAIENSTVALEANTKALRAHDEVMTKIMATCKLTNCK